MQIAGAFLAEEAEIVDQKLNVTGGVLDWVQVPATGLTNENGDQLVKPLFLVTLMQAGPDDQNTPYRMKLEFVASNGDVQTIYEGEIPLGAHQGENRFWVMPIGLCQGHGSGHTVWHCRICPQEKLPAYGPALGPHCTVPNGPASVRIRSR